MVRAERMQQGTRDMLIARDGEEIVCPKGTSAAASCATLTLTTRSLTAMLLHLNSPVYPPTSLVCGACFGRPVAVRTIRFAGGFISVGGGCANAATG
jgi:hypothetical protein